MTKQTIEIDVPDGYEFSSAFPCTDANGEFTERILVTLKKKEPEYFEVREFLFRSRLGGGVIVGVAQKGLESIKDREADKSFIKWVDSDWRKVEI